MAATLMVRDETPAGRLIQEWSMRIDGPITLRELIRTRVREEVARYNAAPTGCFNGLVRPLDAEVELNGVRLRPGRRIDWETQADAAIEAFLRNGFFVIVGCRQVEDLDAELDLAADEDVAFVRLVPLVGG